jgi:hypothetical protein
MLRSLFINERFPKGRPTMSALTVAALPLAATCYTPLAVKKKPKYGVSLTAAQSRSWVQFNYYSLDNPKLTFEQVASKVLGHNPFPRTPQGRKFEQECHKEFDRQRKG